MKEGPCILKSPNCIAHEPANFLCKGPVGSTSSFAVHSSLWQPLRSAAAAQEPPQPWELRSTAVSQESFVHKNRGQAGH